jgi:hypothetical protein
LKTAAQRFGAESQKVQANWSELVSLVPTFFRLVSIEGLAGLFNPISKNK